MAPIILPIAADCAWLSPDFCAASSSLLACSARWPIAASLPSALSLSMVTLSPLLPVTCMPPIAAPVIAAVPITPTTMAPTIQLSTIAMITLTAV